MHTFMFCKLLTLNLLRVILKKINVYRWDHGQRMWSCCQPREYTGYIRSYRSVNIENWCPAGEIKCLCVCVYYRIDVHTRGTRFHFFFFTVNSISIRNTRINIIKQKRSSYTHDLPCKACNKTLYSALYITFLPVKSAATKISKIMFWCNTLLTESWFALCV